MLGIKIFNIYLLTLVILFGSILNVHVDHDQIGYSESETSKEIEKAAFDGQEYLAQFNFLLFEPHQISEASKIYLHSRESHSHSFFTTFLLLRSHRIALPPPTIS